MFGKISDFFHRYAVVVSVLYLGLTNLLPHFPQLAAVGNAITSILGLLSFTPDPAAATAVANAVAAGIAAYGAIFKVVKLILAALKPAAPVV